MAAWGEPSRPGFPPEGETGKGEIQIPCCRRPIPFALRPEFASSRLTPQLLTATRKPEFPKIFAYLLLLEDPDPPPFLCIEEPENGLYHKLLDTLAIEFRAHATGKKNASQIFVTTHQPYFVNALTPEEVWVLAKGADGFSTLQHVSEIEVVMNLVAEELPLGGLWYSDYLDVR